MKLFSFLSKERTSAHSGTDTDTAWTNAVADCLATRPAYFRALHPHNDLPVEQFGYLSALWIDALKGKPNATADAFLNMFEKHQPYKAEVATRLIQAVGNSEGKAKFDIYRLAESIRFHKPTDSFGPLTPRKTVSLCKTIRQESDIFNEDGSIRLFHQQWDNIYIVRNAGAARRIAIWLRLQGYSDYLGRPPKTVPKLPAEVTAFSINQQSFDYLGQLGRLIIFHHDPLVEACFDSLSKLNNLFSYTTAKDDAGTIAFATMPHIDGVDPSAVKSLAALHSWADGLFDPRRYLLERMTTYRS